MATRDVFSEDELAQLRGFPKPARAELILYFTLGSADEAFVRKFRGQDNVLGVVVQLCTLPWLGFLPDDVAAVPAAMVARLSKKLGLHHRARHHRHGRLRRPVLALPQPGTPRRRRGLRQGSRLRHAGRDPPPPATAEYRSHQVYFCSEHCQERFQNSPERHLATTASHYQNTAPGAVDPICGDDRGPGHAAGRRRVNGTDLYSCCAGCAGEDGQRRADSKADGDSTESSFAREPWRLPVPSNDTTRI